MKRILVIRLLDKYSQVEIDKVEFDLAYNKHAWNPVYPAFLQVRLEIVDREDT